MADLGGRQGTITFRGAVKYPGDDRDPPIYMTWPLAYLSVDSDGIALGPSLRLLRLVLAEKRWPWSAILAVQAVRRGVKVVTRDLGEGAPIVFLVEPLPGLSRTTPRLLDTLERFNAPLDRRIHRTDWFRPPVYPQGDRGKPMRLVAWMAWIAVIPLIALLLLADLHPNLIPIFFAATAATGVALAALFVRARRRHS